MRSEHLTLTKIQDYSRIRIIKVKETMIVIILLLPTRLLKELKKRRVALMKKELERIKRDLSATMLMLGRLIATNAVLSEILEKQRQEILYLSTGETEIDREKKRGNSNVQY